VESFPARAWRGGRRRADVWGQCGRERRGGACSPARERRGEGRLTRGPRMSVKERRGRGGCACWAESKGEGEWATGGQPGLRAEREKGEVLLFFHLFCFISKAI